MRAVWTKLLKANDRVLLSLGMFVHVLSEQFCVLFFFCTLTVFLFPRMQVGLKCLSCTPGSHSGCAVRTLLGVNWKILSIRRETMLSGFLSVNA